MNYPASYQKYSTAYPKSEVINAVLWDTLTYTTGVTAQLTFFTATRLTVDLSNMEVAGQLPWPKAFLCRTIKVFIKQRPESVAQAAAGPQGGASDNVTLLVNDAAVRIQIGSKDYGIYPLWMILSAAGPSGVMVLADIGAGAPIVGGLCDYGSLGRPHARDGYTFSVPLFIEPQVNFRVDIFWAAPVALTRTLVGGICVALEGDLIRLV